MKSFSKGDTIKFGRYKGVSIGRVSSVNPGYMEWMRRNQIIDSDTITRHHRGELIGRKDPLSRGYARVWTGT